MLKFFFIIIFFKIGCLLNAVPLKSKLNNQILEYSYVTSETWPGRFGDQLFLLLTTLWVSEKYNIPYIPNLHPLLQGLYINNLQCRHRNLPITSCSSEKSLKELKKPSIIHINYGYTDTDWSYHLAFHQWNSLRANRPFLEKFRKLIQLREPEKYSLIRPSKEYLSVAVHIRLYEEGCSLKSKQLFSDQEQNHILQSQGNNSELYYIDYYYPLKFPPLQYYIDQLNYLSELLPTRSFYVFLFSDYPDIKKIETIIQGQIKSPKQFKFDWREHNFSRKDSLETIYEDFYSLLNFDCLIRSGESNFSQMAHIAKDYEYVIFPTSYYWNDDCLHMTDIHVEKNNQLQFILNQTSY